MDIRIVPGARPTQPGETIMEDIPTEPGPAPAESSEPDNIKFFGTQAK
jgi:hypothetical protein